MLEHLDDDTRKQALRVLRERAQAEVAEPEPRRGLGLRLR
jgi:hypothetical protein